MSIKIAICDDAAEDAAQLSAALLAYDPLFDITTYTNGIMLMDEFLETNHPADLLFLDIYMPGINGIETAQSIRTRHKNMKIIFLSSSKEHYAQAYNVFAFNYMIKPLDREWLYTVLDRALDELRSENRYKICIDFKGTIHNVDCRDIQYIESQNRLLLFHLADESILHCYGRLEEMLKELPKQSFIRCHQSFIINLSCVTEMGENHARIGKTMISISRKYVKHVKNQYYTYLFSSMGGGRLHEKTD